MGFLNRTGAEIGYQLDKKCKKIIFYYWKNEKIPEVPSSACPTAKIWQLPPLQELAPPQPPSCIRTRTCRQAPFLKGQMKFERERERDQAVLDFPCHVLWKLNVEKKWRLPDSSQNLLQIPILFLFGWLLCFHTWLFLFLWANKALRKNVFIFTMSINYGYTPLSNSLSLSVSQNSIICLPLCPEPAAASPRPLPAWCWGGTRRGGGGSRGGSPGGPGVQQKKHLIYKLQFKSNIK